VDEERAQNYPGIGITGWVRGMNSVWGGLAGLGGQTVKPRFIIKGCGLGLCVGPNGWAGVVWFVCLDLI
jgi:hypothetical protein